MSFSVGIVGLPNAGKSTLFSALTKKTVDIAPYPFTTIDPNVGVVAVPDKRLEKIAEIIRPEKITPTIIEFVDIAGLVKNAHKGEGLGNQFLAQIRQCDAILEVVRKFVKDGVEHVEKTVNPQRDIEIIKTELIMKDLETLEGITAKLEKEAKGNNKEALKKLELLKKLQEASSQAKTILETDLNEKEKKEIEPYQFLTAKPIFYVLNTNEEDKEKQPGPAMIELNLKLEQETAELSPAERKELNLASQLDSLIVGCYNILDLITFYTIAGGKEVRAWTVSKNSTAPEAGGRVHSDFKEKFIKAEVISGQDLIKASGWNKAREQGLIKTVGRNYIVNDGDVVEFKI